MKSHSEGVWFLLLGCLVFMSQVSSSFAAQHFTHIPDYSDHVDIYASLRANPYADIRPGQDLIIEVSVENRGKDTSSRVKVEVFYEQEQLQVINATFPAKSGWVSKNGYERLELTFNELKGQTNQTAQITTRIPASYPSGGILRVWAQWAWRYKENHSWATEIERTVTGKTNILTIPIITPSPTPTPRAAYRPPVSAPINPIYQQNQVGADQRCFAETGGFCIHGEIRAFWERHGAERIFGYPIGSQKEEWIEGQPIQVQWFQRVRLELHPENPLPNTVLVGRVGAELLTQQGRDWFAFPKAIPHPRCRFFPQTQHNVCDPILAYWSQYGIERDGIPYKSDDESLALFGLPLSDLQMESLSDGRQYAVQWFERARLELHPENVPPNHVLAGLLGNEIQNR